MVKTERRRASAKVTSYSEAPTDKYGGKKILAVLLLCFVAALILTYIITHPGMSRYREITAVNGSIVIPLTAVADGKARFFSLAEGGKVIRFFIVKGSDRRMHSAFEVCSMCGNKQRGFDQNGPIMICRNCTQKFLINQIGSTVTGSCNPIPLPCSVDGKNLVLKLTDIQQGYQLFP
ncbi:MAG: DUF2318 domain-containing protein [Geobacteraceae bacterium]|nr:DUF2318 domain-containing protein [Geobacteraceae bacterium]